MESEKIFPASKPVFWFTEDGEQKGCAQSVRKAAQILGVPETTVSYAVRHPRAKVGGFYLRTAAEFTPPPGKKSRLGRVRVTDAQDNVKIYDSPKAAADAIGGTYSSVMEILHRGVLPGERPYPYKRRYFIEWVKEEQL